MHSNINLLGLFKWSPQYFSLVELLILVLNGFHLSTFV